MTTAAIVTGNTVVIKPRATRRHRGQFFELMEEAIAGRRRQLPHRRGAAVGDTLVEHPKTRFVSFTGSKAVGIGINARREVRAGQIWIKRVVAEMGGKDAIIVDDDADLDAAPPASSLRPSASRARSARPAPARDRLDGLRRVLAKLKPARRVNRVPASRPGAVPWARSRATGAREDPRVHRDRQGKRPRVAGGGRSRPARAGFIQPTVIADVKPKAASRRRRSSGPVLAVIPAEDFDDALAIANNTDYGLTGAVYSRPRAHRAREARVPRRQPLHQPQVHRRAGGRASVRRLQHVGHGLQGRRARLPGVVFAGEVGGRETVKKHPQSHTKKYERKGKSLCSFVRLCECIYGGMNQ